MWRDFSSAVQGIDVTILDRGGLGDLAARVGSARAVLDGLEARIAVALRRLGASEATTAETLRRRTGCSAREARHRARRAETLDQMPNVAGALSSGRLTGEHASALARAAAETSPEAVDSDLGLLAAAEAVPADLASHRAKDWARQQQTGDDLDRLHQWQRRHRSLNFTEGHGGMLNGIAKFDRVSGAQFQSLVGALADRLYRADGGRDNPGARSRAQCRHDALLALVGIEPTPPATNGHHLDGRETAGAAHRKRPDRLRPPPVKKLPALVGSRTESGDTPFCDDEPRLHRSTVQPRSASPGDLVQASGDTRNGDAPGGTSQPDRKSTPATGSLGSPGDRPDSIAASGLGLPGSGSLVPPGDLADSVAAGGLGLPGSGSLVGPGDLVDGVAAGGLGLPGSGSLVPPGDLADSVAASGLGLPGSGSLVGPGDLVDSVASGGLGSGRPGRSPGAAVWPGCTCGRGLGVRGQLSIVLDVPHIANNGKQGRCEIPGIGEIARSELERRACDADLYGLIFSSDGLPLHHGRKTRTVSPQQWRVLVARDRGCVICGIRPDWCQAHHIKPWLRGGRTDIDNLALVCHGHHRWIHDNNITLQRGPNGWRAPPDVPMFRPVT